MNKIYSSFVLVLCLYSNATLASELDQVKVGSLICETDHSYNETVLVDLQNQLAAIKGTPKTPYPKDCRFIRGEPLVVNFGEYSGGSAVVTKDGKTLYTSKENVVLGNKALAEELHLICTGEKHISADNDTVWSNEIVVELRSAEVIKFGTSWTLAEQSADYTIEAFAEIDDSTIKIYDRAVGGDGVWEKLFVISRVDGSVEAFVTKTGSVAIRGKCTRNADRAF